MAVSTDLHNICSHILHNAVIVDLADKEHDAANTKCCYFIIYSLQDNGHQHSCF